MLTTILVIKFLAIIAIAVYIVIQEKRISELEDKMIKHALISNQSVNDKIKDRIDKATEEITSTIMKDVLELLDGQDKVFVAQNELNIEVVSKINKLFGLINKKANSKK
jgi:hypothetical protein